MMGDNNAGGDGGQEVSSSSSSSGGGRTILYSALRMVGGVQVKLLVEEELRNGHPTFHLNQEIIGSYFKTDREETKNEQCPQEDDDFECVNCKKKFTSLSLLNRHTKVHGNAFICNFVGCRAGFIHAGTLTKHKESHRHKITVGPRLQGTPPVAQGSSQNGTTTPGLSMMMPMMEEEDQVRSPMMYALGTFNYDLEANANTSSGGELKFMAYFTELTWQKV